MILRHNPWVLIVGSRSLKFNTDARHAMEEAMSDLSSDVVVLTGGAAGPDKWAEELAPGACIIVKPNWNGLGLSAGPVRNGWMLDMLPQGSLVWAFYDGKSKGTLATINQARRRGFSPTIWLYV